MSFVVNLLSVFRLIFLSPSKVSREIGLHATKPLAAVVLLTTVVGLEAAISVVLSVPPHRMTADNAIYGFLWQETNQAGYVEEDVHTQLESMAKPVVVLFDSNPKGLKFGDFRSQSVEDISARAWFQIVNEAELGDIRGMNTDIFVADLFPGGSLLGFFLEANFDIRYADELKQLLPDELTRDYYEIVELWVEPQFWNYLIDELGSILIAFMFCFMMSLFCFSGQWSLLIVYCSYLIISIDLWMVVVFYIVIYFGVYLALANIISLIFGFLVFQYWSFFIVRNIGLGNIRLIWLRSNLAIFVAFCLQGVFAYIVYPELLTDMAAFRMIMGITG